MSKELIVIENIVPEKVFVENGLSAVLTDIENQVKPLVFDVSSEKGRKEVASVCYKIKRTKTAIDTCGKEYVAELKKLPKIVDAERKRAREALEALEEGVRQPLTDWETAEKARTDGILKRINDIDPFQGGMISIAIGDYSINELKAMESKAINFAIDDSLDEFIESGSKKKEEVCLKLAGIIAQQEKYEAEQAELERLRKESAEREQAEREAKIAQEAAERARLEAEQKAEKEKQELIRKERAAQEAVARAEQDKLLAEKQAKEDQERAVQAERERQERIKRDQFAKEAAEIKAAERKAANKKHRAKINNEAEAAIVLAISEVDTGNHENAQEIGKALVTAIEKGEIPNISINY